MLFGLYVIQQLGIQVTYGMYAYFGQIMSTDTLKVCYDVWLYENNTMEVCSSDVIHLDI